MILSQALRNCVENLGLTTCNDPGPGAEYLIVPKLAATPRDVLLLASHCKNGQRNEPRRVILSVEPTVGKDDLTVLPSSIGFQFVRKL